MIEPSHVTVLIPTYNEAENISLIIDEVFHVDPALSVLVLDDNSPDGTAAIVEAKKRQYPRLRILKRMHDRGFARSYLDGFRRVLAEGASAAVITMDADFSHEPKEIPHLLRVLNNGAGVALGSRHVKGGKFLGISLWRRVLSRFANSYARAILGLPIHDCTSGYIAMSTSALRALDLNSFRSEGYGFLFELKHRLHRSGCRLVEHPVRWPDRHQGKSKISKKIIWESFLLPWKIKFSAGAIDAAQHKTRVSYPPST